MTCVRQLPLNAASTCYQPLFHLSCDESRETGDTGSLRCMWSLALHREWGQDELPGTAQWSSNSSLCHGHQERLLNHRWRGPTLSLRFSTSGMGTRERAFLVSSQEMLMWLAQDHTWRTTAVSKATLAKPSSVLQGKRMREGSWAFFVVCSAMQ